mmetsp:Transcript_15320/g.23244  ORF Transcript_15320/g.23244 Transcript_15320/m.23244 type:complete len:83 (+) Transcript_15320:225-473(+)
MTDPTPWSKKSSKIAYRSTLHSIKGWSHGARLSQPLDTAHTVHTHSKNTPAPEGQTTTTIEQAEPAGGPQPRGDAHLSEMEK